jgi:hypothetical protein
MKNTASSFKVTNSGIKIKEKQAEQFPQAGT